MVNMSVFRRKGSPFFWIEFEFRGRRIRQSSGTTSIKKAQEVERRFRQQLHDQLLLGHVPASTMTIGEAVERYASTHLRMKKRRLKTVKADAYLLDKLVERLGGDDVLLTSLTMQRIGDFKEQLIRQPLQPASVNKYLASIKAILRKAHSEWGVLQAVPAISLLTLNNDRIRWIDKHEELRLLAVCKRNKHLHDLVIFLLDTGARLSEATGLEWKDVELDHQPRPFVRFMQTKSGKPRTVPLTARATGLLKDLYILRPAGEPHVFLQRFPGHSWRGTKPRAKPFYNPHGSWDNAVERSGLGDLHLHDLRHTYASRLVQKGVPLLNVSNLLGHSSLKMTMRYAHLAPSNLDDAVSVPDAVPP